MQLIEIVIAGGCLLVLAIEAFFGLFELFDSDSHRGFSWSCALLGGLSGVALLVGSPPREPWVSQVATFSVGVSSVGLFSAWVSSKLAPRSPHWHAPALASSVAFVVAILARLSAGAGSAA